MALHVKLLTNDFTETLDYPNLEFEVQRYSFHMWGGPDRARIEAIGADTDLIEMLDRLRAPVKIWDDLGECVWWGYLNRVRTQIQNIEWDLGLDEMYNQIQVAYTSRGAGQTTTSTRLTTTVSSNTESVLQYGTKEGLLSLNSAGPFLARAYRDFRLTRDAFPRVQDISLQRESENAITFDCLGWWHTLSWQYHTIENLGSNSHIDGTTEGVFQNMGDSTTTQIAQSITIDATTDWTVQDIDAVIVKEGSPSDSVTIALHDDNSGEPGTLIASNTKMSSSISDNTTTPEFVQVTISNSEVTNGTTYWIVISRTGSQNTSNYYKATTKAGFGQGALSTYDGAVWSTTSTDMHFVLGGGRATDVQMRALIDDVGQFISGRIVEDTGVIMPPLAMSSDTHALATLEELLDCGTSLEKRLVAEVSTSRRIAIQTEPLKIPATGTNIQMLANGDFLDTSGTKIPKSHIYKLVGQWVEPSIASLIGNDSKLASLRWLFIEYVEYDAQRDEITQIRPRDGIDVFDFSSMAER